MKTFRLICRRGLAALGLAIAALAQQPAPATATSAPLPVCATTPDLAAICREVGGDAVVVESFATGVEDPHFLDARPSAIRRLNKARLLLVVGRELETGWLPVLLQNARNPAVLDGGDGHFVAAEHVRALNVPTGPVDRSHGDVHVGGNPHFLTDPLCGLQVAKALAQRLAAIEPRRATEFERGFQALRRKLAEAAVGAIVAERYGYDAEKLLVLLPGGKLEAVLKEQGDFEALGGWAGAMQKHRGAAVVADHDLWPYFAERFDLRVVAFLEPKPGIAPTTAHLQEVIAMMKRDHVGAILSVPYFAEQHAVLVARATGSRVAAMAHQCGARARTDDYVAFVDHDVRAVVEVLGRR